MRTFAPAEKILALFSIVQIRLAIQSGASMVSLFKTIIYGLFEWHIPTLTAAANPVFSDSAMICTSG
ncbi:hypothetical protein JCM31739_06910 [Faecalimonas canis]